MSNAKNDMTLKSTAIKAADIASATQESVQRALACRRGAVELTSNEIEHVGGAVALTMTTIRPPITIGLLAKLETIAVQPGVLVQPGMVIGQ